MRANFVLSGVAAGIRRNLTMTVALILNTAIALGFVGAAILASTEITKFRQAYADKLRVQVYLCTSIAHDSQVTERDLELREQRPARPVTCAKNQKTSPAETSAVAARLKKDPRVQSFTYVDEERAFTLGLEHSDPASRIQLEKLGVGTLPASFSVQLVDLQNDYTSFAKDYNDIQGVDQVNNQVDTIKPLLSLMDSVRWLSIVVAIVVLGASVLLIGNTIQVAANQRRNETGIMRLVGASRWMTELPFIIEALVATLIGGLIGIGFVAIGKYVVLDRILGQQTSSGVIPNLNTNDVLVAGGAGLAAGLVLSALTAFVTLRTYVRL
jgi:cell division transport system permease protein